MLLMLDWRQLCSIKASLVIGGEADVYIHNSGLYEWDVCGIIAVALPQLTACQLDGTTIFNKEVPIVRGLIISHPELIDDTNVLIER